jgi:hypothetical protein
MQTGNFISEDANYEFNKGMLFKLNTSIEDLYAFDLNEKPPDSTHLKFVSALGGLDFENSNFAVIDTLVTHSGRKSLRFTMSQEFGEALVFPLPSGARRGDYIKVALWAYILKRVNHYKMGRIVVSLEKGDKSVLWKSIRIDNKLGARRESASLFGGTLKAWAPIQYFVRIDTDPAPGMQVKIYGWNPGHSDFWIDDISAELFRSED